MQKKHRFTSKRILYGGSCLIGGCSSLAWIYTHDRLNLGLSLLDYGRSLWQWWLLMPLVVLLVPIFLAAYLRQPILSITDDRLNQDGHRYLTRLNRLTLSTWLSWLALSFMPESSLWLNHALGAERTFGREIAEITLLVAPPVLAITFCHHLAYPVFSRLGSVWTCKEVLQQTVWRQLHHCLPLVLLFSGGRLWWTQQVTLAVFFLAAACLSHLGFTHWTIQSRNSRPQAITTGELRDRIFGLAQRAGIHLNQLYILSVGRHGWPNAYATQNGQIILTDRIFHYLTQREVDAIVAHELAHLQARHPQLLQMILAGAVLTTIGLASALSTWLPIGLMVGSSMLLWLMIYYHFAHQCEYQADRQAIRLTNDPIALISSLTKLAKLHRSSSSRSHRFTTHPSTQQRIAAITDRYQLDQTSFPPESAPLFYPLPPASTTPLLFSSAWKKRLLLNWQGLKMTGLAIVPAIVSGLVQHQVWSPAIEGGLVIGSSMVMVVGLVGLKAQFCQWHYDRLKSRLDSKLQQKDLTPIAWGGVLAGLSPHATPCRYEGLPIWDLGFLILQGDRLCYVGEQAQFGIQRDRICQIKFVDQVGFDATTLKIDWQDPAGRIQSLQLQVYEQQAIALIQQWQRQINQPHCLAVRLADLNLPNWGSVTHQPWLLRTQWQQSVQDSLLILAVSFGLGIGLNLPWNWQPGSSLWLLCLGLIGAIGPICFTHLLQLIPVIHDGTSSKTCSGDCPNRT